ncbi:MAG: adenylyl-sulfate kinase [Vampirovibrionia bacterium]
MIEQKGFTIWFTGLPYSGMSEIAVCLEGELLERGLKVELLDENNNLTSKYLCSDYNFTLQSKNHVAERFGYITQLLSRNNIIAIAATISPLVDTRNFIRKNNDNFLEIYVRYSREKSLQYALDIDNSEAIDLINNYEDPRKPEVIVDPINESVEDSVKIIIRTLEILKWVPPLENADYSKADEDKIHKRLESLGYL